MKNNIADDIPLARDAGKSDVDIINGYKTYAPEHADAIDQALKAGKTPKEIVDGIASYDAAQNPHDTSYASALQKGVTDLAGGIGKTMDMEGVTNGTTAGSVKGALQSVGNMGAEDYKPAAPKLMHPSTWGQIPRALIENSPSLGTDIAAGGVGAGIGGFLGPIGAAVGGATGMAASHWLHSGGNDAQAHANATNPQAQGSDAPITDSDKNSAILNAGIQGTLGRVGLAGLPGKILPGAIGTAVKASEGSVMGQVAKQMARGAATDAATTAAGNAAQQMTVNDKSLTGIDMSSVGDSALVGAAQGAGIRAVGGVKDVTSANKFKDITPEAATPVAKMLSDAVGPEGIGKSGKADFEAINKVEDDLNAKVNNGTAQANVKAHMKALDEANPGNDNAETLMRVKQDIAAGRRPASDDMQSLRDNLGSDPAAPHSQELVDTLGHMDTLNAIKKAGNWDKGNGTFLGGASGTNIAENFLHPLAKAGLKSDAWSMVASLGAHQLVPSSIHALSSVANSPWLGVAEPAIRSATYSALRGMDSITGNRHPLSQFTGRFGEPLTNASAGTDTKRPQSFLETQAIAEAKAKAKLDADKQASSTKKSSDKQDVANEASKAKLAEKVRNQWFAEQRYKLELQTNSAKAEEATKQKSFNDSLTQARDTLKLMKNSDTASSSDATLPIKVAKLRQGYEQASEAKKASEAKDKQKELAQNLRDNAFRSRIRRNSSEDGPVSDIRLNRRVVEITAGNKAAEAKAKQNALDQVLKNAKATSRLMANSSEDGPSSPIKANRAVAKITRDTASDAKASKDKSLDDALKQARVTNALRRNSEKSSSSDATLPIKVAKLKQDNAKAADREQVTEATQKTPKTPKVVQATSAPKEAPVAPKEAPTGNMMRITSKSGHHVDRSFDGVDNPARYADQTRNNMDERHDAVVHVQSFAGDHKALKDLVHKLNHVGAGKEHAAYSLIEHAVNELPEHLRVRALDTLAPLLHAFQS